MFLFSMAKYVVDSRVGLGSKLEGKKFPWWILGLLAIPFFIKKKRKI